MIRIGEARTAATHAATEDDQVACGNKRRKNAKPAEISADLQDTTCRACRAQKHDLIGKNVAEFVDLPEGQPGRPSRAMTEEQAGKVLATARGPGTRTLR